MGRLRYQRKPPHPNRAESQSSEKAIGGSSGLRASLHHDTDTFQGHLAKTRGVGANTPPGEAEQVASYRRWERVRRETERAPALAGPVAVTFAVRCECGQWMRPGRDHTCPTLARVTVTELR
jgi:hypothetical protein